MSDDDRLNAALDDVRATHEEYILVSTRLREIRESYRKERDEAIRKAVQIGGVPAKKAVCIIIDATPQWLNKLLRGEAYRRRED